MSRFRFYSIVAIVPFAIFVLLMNTVGYLSNPHNYPNSHSPKVMSIQVHNWTRYQSRPTQLPAILPDWVAEKWDDFTGNRIHITDIRQSNSIATPLTGDDINELKRLEGRHINGVELMDAEINGVLQYLPKCAQVVKLDVNRLGSDVDGSVEIISKIKTLQFLQISDDRLSDQNIERLVQNSDLQALHIDGTNLGPHGIAAIAKSRNLVSIHLNKGKLTGDQWCTILSASNLLYIVLKDCVISQPRPISTGVASRLRFLQLIGTSVSSEVLLAVPAIPSLQYLSLQFGRIDARMAKDLGRLRRSKISIWKCRVEDDFLTALESVDGLTLSFRKDDIPLRAMERLRKTATVKEFPIGPKSTQVDTIQVDF